MSDNQSEGEGDFTNEAKYRQYSASVERALKSFELSTEWHDLISCLARINKVFLAYKQYPVVPIQLTVSKRLSQCLHPNLPSGVHLKALSVYTAIFDRIGSKGLASNLLVYSSSLFPLMGYASMSVRPHLLAIYEQYYLPLGDGLMPALHGFVLGLLPGLEDESEHTDRICRLLDAICSVTDESAFFCALWRCVLGSPDVRLPAVSFVLSKLNKKVTAEDQVYCLGGHLPLVVSALCSALLDRNVLVGRAVLDIVSVLFPLHQSFLIPADLTTILSAALQTLLKRDVSLNRRLYAWLLGSSVDKSHLANRLHSTVSPKHDRKFVITKDISDGSNESPHHSAEPSYFEAFSKAYLVSALKMIISQASLSAKHGMYKAECILPYRLLRALVDKPELGLPVLDEVMFDLVCCLKQQISDLGGLGSPGQTKGTKLTKLGGTAKEEALSKKPSKKGALKAEILQSSSLFFSSLDSEVLFRWTTDLLRSIFSQKQGRGGENSTSDPGKNRHQEKSEESLAEESVETVNIDREGSHSSSPTVELEEVQLGDKLEGRQQDERGEEEKRSGQLDDQKTTSNQAPASSSSVVTAADTRQDLSFVLELIKFLIQSLPLESIENVHRYHLPHLLLSLFSELAQKESTLSTCELQASFSLSSLILHELLTYSSSHSGSLASTPSTPVPRTPFSDSPSLARVNISSIAAQRQLSEDMLTRQFEELKSLAAINYLEFFSRFLDGRVLNQQSGRMRGGHFKAVYSNACDLLLLSARLCSEMALIENEQTATDPPVWLKHLMSACSLNPADPADHHHHSIVFISLETLLTLLDWQLQLSHGRDPSCPLPSSTYGYGTMDTSSVMRSNFLSKHAVDHVLLNVQFEKCVCEHLWRCLSPGCVELHSEAAILMSWVNSLFAPSSVCEKVILEHFTSQGMVAYQSFAALWQYSPSAVHRTPPRPFNRAILRMLEGLQSRDAAVRHFVGSWVRHTTTAARGELDMARLLQPLLRILAEAQPLRRSEQSTKYTFSPYEVRLSKEEAAKDPAYAKYYFSSLGISDPEEAHRRSQYRDGLQYYIQVFDINQVLYSLSLLLSTVQVDPAAIVSSMSGIVVDPSSYMNIAAPPSHPSLTVVEDASRKESSTPHDESGQLLSAGSSQKSILELFLTTCIQFLQSEFHHSLEVSLEDHLEHTNVKILCTDLLEVVHMEFVHTLAKAHNSSSPASSSSERQQAATTAALQADSDVLPNRGGANVANASYVTALVTLCDVQKSTLLLLARIVQEMRELERERSNVDPSSRGKKPLLCCGGSCGDDGRFSLWKQLLIQHNQREEMCRGQQSSSSVSTSQNPDPSVVLGSLFVHLLKLVQSLITLDSQCHVCNKLAAGSSRSAAGTPFSLPTTTLASSSSVTAGFKLSDGSELPPVLSGITTASQPFFQTLLLDILSDVTLGRLHTLVLAVFTTVMPNLIGHQVDELAPKILKQLCKNLEQPSRSVDKLPPEHKTAGRKGSLRSSFSSREQNDLLRHNTISYLESAVTIVLWCLFGEKNGGFSPFNEKGKPLLSSSFQSDSSLLQHSMNLFWRVTSIAEREEANLDLTPALKQTSAITWLLGVFSQKGGGVTETGGGGGGGERDGSSGGSSTLSSGLIGASSTGLNSLVGQYVVMLLPAVYKVLTDLWRASPTCSSGSGSLHTNSSSTGGAGVGSCCGMVVEPTGVGGPILTHSFSTEAGAFEKAAARNSKLECGEVHRLISQLLCPLAEREPTAFFSSISHVWLEWNLETQAKPSKKLNKRKDTFIEMLHRIKVLPLERVISCVQDTLVEISHLDEIESGVLRQKYLLHFLYKYISSALQSSEELGECRLALVSFLRNCFNLCYTPRPECLTNNCHILCMLTSILHVFVCRVPAPDPKKQKKERKDLQDVTHKLCEAMSTTANIGLNQADYIAINRTESSISTAGASATTTTTATTTEASSSTNNSQPSPAHTSTSERPSPAAAALPIANQDGETSLSGASDNRRKTVEESETLVNHKTESAESERGLTTPRGGHVTAGEAAAMKLKRIGVKEGGAAVGSSSSSSKGNRTTSGGGEMQLPAKQALAVLSNVLSHFIDCVFDGSEKDKVISLLKSVMYNVWPHLHNHSSDFQPCYMHAVKLLSSLSGFQVTRKAWRKEAFDLFLDPSFFAVELEALREWKVVIDNLMTQDQVTFRDLLTRLNTSAATNVVNIFSSLEQEVVTGARLVKRMAFALLSGETDQYVSFLPDIQEKLSEYLKFLRYPVICSEVLLAFRVILLKFSPPHVLAFWPPIITELLSLLGRLETDLCTELSDGTVQPPSRLQLYLAVCKLLDTAMALPQETLPHFQLLRWGFTSHRAYADSGGLVVTRLCRHYQTIESKEAPHPSPPAGFPRLLTHSISSLKELKPLFDTLLHQNRSVASNHHHHHHHQHSKLTHSSSSSLAGAAASGASPSPSPSSASSAILGHSGNLEARLTAIETLLLCDFVESFPS